MVHEEGLSPTCYSASDTPNVRLLINFLSCLLTYLVFCSCCGWALLLTINPTCNLYYRLSISEHEHTASLPIILCEATDAFRHKSYPYRSLAQSLAHPSPDTSNPRRGALDKFRKIEINALWYAGGSIRAFIWRCSILITLLCPELIFILIISTISLRLSLRLSPVKHPGFKLHITKINFIDVVLIVVANFII